MNQYSGIPTNGRKQLNNCLKTFDQKLIVRKTKMTKKFVLLFEIHVK